MGGVGEDPPLPADPGADIRCEEAGVTLEDATWSGRVSKQDMIERARALAFLVEEGYASNLIEAAMRFAWNKANLSTALVGFSSMEHLEQAITAQTRGGLPAVRGPGAGLR